MLTDIIFTSLPKDHCHFFSVGKYTADKQLKHNEFFSFCTTILWNVNIYETGCDERKHIRGTQIGCLKNIKTS